MAFPKKITMPGYRILKTGIAVVLCFVLYHYIGRQGTTLAVTAAIICMQDSVEKSLASGRNRIIGTLIGGGLGALFVFFNIPQSGTMGLLFCAFTGVVLLLHSFNLFNIKESMVISCLVFIMIITDAGASDLTPLAYSIGRTIDTLFGIVVSVIVNVSLFRPVEQEENGGLPIATLKYDVIRHQNFKVSKWQGGETFELYIYPEEAIYCDKDFDFRLSSASVELESTAFTKFPGYRRYIMPLEGEIHLYHEGFHNIELLPFHKDCFKGEWDTRCVGKCTDFNLIVNDKYNGSIDSVKSGFHEEFTTASHVGFYCLFDNCQFQMTDGVETITEILNKGDFLCIKHDIAKAAREYKVAINCLDECEGCSAILSQCHSK